MWKLHLKAAYCDIPTDFNSGSFSCFFFRFTKVHSCRIVRLVDWNHKNRSFLVAWSCYMKICHENYETEITWKMCGKPKIVGWILSVKPFMSSARSEMHNNKSFSLVHIPEKKRDNKCGDGKQLTNYKSGNWFFFLYRRERKKYSKE